MSQAEARPWWAHPLLPTLLLLLGIARQLQVNLRWLAEDLRVGVPVASGVTWWLNKTIWLHGQGGLLAQRLDGHPPPDLLSIAGLAGWLSLGREPDAVVITVLLLLVATQLMMMDVGRRLGSIWAGAAAALALGVAPELSAMARCWAPQVPQLFLLVLTTELLLISRSFSRPLPVLAFVPVGIAGMVLGAMSTDNLLFALALTGLGGASVLRGVALGRGPTPDQRVSRWRSALLGPGALALIAWGSYRLYYRWQGMQYYSAEIENEAYHTVAAWWHPAALSAYPRWLFHFGFGPALGALLALGLLAYIALGRGRAELLGQGLFPLVVLGVLYKKNPYYASVTYPALALGGMLGLAALARRSPWLRRGATLAAVLALGLAWNRWERASQPQLHHRQPTAMPDRERVFQTARPPELFPRKEPPDLREQRLIRQHLGSPSCPEGRRLCFLPRRDDTAHVLIALGRDPCLMQGANDDGSGRRCDWILARDDGCDAQAVIDGLGAPGWTVSGEDRHDEPCLWMLERSGE
jgi:hypothetical protein